MNQTKQVPKNYDYQAPDGSEIRLLLEVKGGGLCHCTLPVGGVSKAVKHKTVDEVWYFISGKGIVWRKNGSIEDEINVKRGTSISIPVGTHFQFKNIGKMPLKFIILTSPCWTGAEEAVSVIGKF
jgi:mannose-6-phosphate isomerase-like protein (cupin superfamily)